jgi:O-6-methylguanine DNA methyltransferase
VNAGPAPVKLFQASYASPIGLLRLLATSDALCALAFEANWQRVLRHLAADPISAVKAENDIIAQTCWQLSEYFLGHRKSFEIPLDITGTVFQKQVWQSLKHIPYGAVWTYSQQAEWINQPKALRAAGSANGMNPVAILIPCHRVIPKSGGSGGYSGGSPIKTALICLEKKYS